jgi:hypothetical protein
MTIDQKSQDQEFAAKHAADDAAFQQKQAQDNAKFQADKALSEKVFADRKAEEAGAPARQAQQDSANRGIIGGVLGMVGVMTGASLLGKLDGVAPIATLSGPQNGNVIENKAQENGFKIASPAANAPAAPQMTVMNFLTPPKPNGP